MPEQMDNPNIQFCTFYLNDVFFGLDVMSVQEVVRWQHLTKIPLVDSFIKGLMNLRGQIVMAVDLKQCLGFEAYTEDKCPYNLVVQDEGHSLSLLVDKVGDVLELSSHAMEIVPENLDAHMRPFVDGVFKLNRRFLMILNLSKLTTHMQNVKTHHIN